MTKQQVLLLGSTGNTGKTILNGLLEHGGYEVRALVRPSSAEKPAVKKIAERGVKIVIADIAGPVEELVSVQRGVDITISAIDAISQKLQMNLATAAKEAGVKRFVPCAWITVVPPGGIMRMRDDKEEVYNHIKRLYLPYTIIDVGAWYNSSFPTELPSGRFDYATFWPKTVLHGDGERPNMLVDIRDIGRWTARILKDDRTLNKYVIAYSDVLSENQIWSIVEEATGEKLERKKISYEEIVATTEDLRAQGITELLQYVAEYDYTMYVRGDNQPEYAKYLGYVDARELYPDFKPITFRDFVKELLDGKVSKPQYDFA